MDALRRLASLAVGVGLALFPELAGAQSVPTTLDEGPQTARSLAMGGGLYGGATSTTALFANPAGMALTHVYHLDAIGVFDSGASRFSAGAAIVDSSHSVAAGLAYNYSDFWTSPDGRYTHDVRVALAIPITQSLTLGVTGRYMDATGSATSNGIPGQSFNGFTLDAGVAFKPFQFVQLGVTGFSLTNPDTTVTPLAIAGGIAVYPVESLTFNFDTYWDMHSWEHPQGRFSGGAEFLAGTVPLRAGYVYDAGRGSQAFTAGLGWIDQAFSVEAAIRQEVVVPAGDSRQTTLLLNVRYFYRLL